jgi:prephenate dehydrogenase
VIDEYSLNLAKALAGADMVVIATPLQAAASLMPEIARHAGGDTVITDVGSVKGSVAVAARSAFGDKLQNFVPGHPIAGTERSGVEASFAELFVDHLVILTPLPANSPAAVATVSRMWERTGARVLQLDVDYHDRVLAATSHLPHVLAYALVDCLAQMEGHDDIFRFSAGGFRDFTRIASSSPEMWSDICIANADRLLDVIANYNNRLDDIARLIKERDRDGLMDVFSRVKTTRDNLPAGKK